MAVRIRGFRTVAGVHTLVTLVTLASAIGTQRPVAAQQGWASRSLRSVVVRQGDGPTVVDERRLEIPASEPAKAVTPRVVTDGQFDNFGASEGVVIEGHGLPGASPGYAGEDYGTSVGEGHHDAGYGDEGILIEGGHAACWEPGCPHCSVAAGGHGRPWFNAFCEPIGLTQRLAGLLHHHCKDECWTARGDALILWRNAPAARPLYLINQDLTPVPIVALDAAQLESPAAGGGRLQLFRHDPCGDVLEIGYLFGGQFFSEQVRPFLEQGYETAPPGLDGLSPDIQPLLDQVGAQVVGSIQSAEINRRHAFGASMQFLYGFRWLNWYEQSIVADAYGSPDNLGADIYETTTINNLWGGQIGFDTLLLKTGHGFRVEGIVKAGAYANNAGQNSSYLNISDADAQIYAASVRENGWPASASFVGEVGMTGVMPIGENWDFRFGYLGLWLTGIAQPFKQLSGQDLAPGSERLKSLSAVGTVIVQGVTLGLEGRW